MNTERKKQILAIIACVSLVISALTVRNAFAATSTITITSTPFLSFIDIPDSVQVHSITVPTVDTEITSDSDGFLSSPRFLRIQDTRGCGGLNLQAQADDFTPATTPEMKNELRLVTSTTDFVDAVVVGGVKYFAGFTGDQGITTPLNVAGPNFSDPTLFTGAPFDTVDNTLDSPLDLMQGNLTAPTGRSGAMQIDLSYYLLIPKYTPPNNYYTTLTFTLSDDTTGVCP